MKKVMVGILILIPVLILLIVAAVSNILSLAAWIAVDNIILLDRKTGNIAESVQVIFSEEKQTYNFNNYVKVIVEPERANRYTLEWRISGEVECMDDSYDSSVQPAAMLVDNHGYEVESNSTGRFVISAYCRFNLTVQAEQVSKTLSVTVEGYDVESIKIVEVEEDVGNTMKVGESKRVDAMFTPMSSRVTKTRWHSSDESVATIDENGVITAVGVGNTDITVEANKDENKDEYVTSAVYPLEVVAGVSKFGNSLFTSSRSVQLDDIGVLAGDVVSCDGCRIVENSRIDIFSETSTVNTKNGTLTIRMCADDAIAIANADKFDEDSGFVFALGGPSLQLHAVWADQLKAGNPEDEGFGWSTSDASKATVTADGVVTAKSVGHVRITATKWGKSVSVLLNVQRKVVSMQLRTSDYSLAVGLARETVFAAEKYTDISVDNTKEANSVSVEIVGAPIRGEFDEDETEQEYRSRLAEFYDTYAFEILSGEEYAEFGGEFGNLLTFIPIALDGKGRQTVKVQVSAKYPRYNNSFTQGVVDINVIYGVEVTNIVELRQAAKDQETYARADGNIMDAELVFEHTNTSDGRSDRYRVRNESRSRKTYAISFAADVAFEKDEDGNPLPVGESIYVYGNVYGNNHKLTAEFQQLGRYFVLFYVTWSDVVISNVNIRANAITESGEISNDETSAFTGQCIRVSRATWCEKWRITNVRVEYCILENARRAYEFSNADVTMEGNIMRNLSNTAISAVTTMRTYVEEDGIKTTFPIYTKIEMINNIFSNCFASVAYLPYETFTYMPKTNGKDYGKDGEVLYKDYSDKKVASGVGRFVRNDLNANAEYFKQHFIPAGINSSVIQKGFLDIYNWQNVEMANLIGDLGSDTLNSLLTAATGSLIKVNKTFAPVLYYDKESGDLYFHMGFLTAGLDIPSSIFSEPIHMTVSLEDRRFDSIYTYGMKKYCNDIAGSVAEDILASSQMKYYSYSNQADITPFSTYVVNSALIAHLHGER